MFLYRTNDRVDAPYYRYIVSTHKRTSLSFIHGGGGGSGVSARHAHTSTPGVLRVSAAAI